MWKKVQRWFEVEVMADTSHIDSTVFALMIRAAFTMLSGSTLDRALRHYIYYAESTNHDILDGTMACEDFTAAELETLVRLQPDKYRLEPIEDPEEQVRQLL